MSLGIGGHFPPVGGFSRVSLDSWILKSERKSFAYDWKPRPVMKDEFAISWQKCSFTALLQIGFRDAFPDKSGLRRSIRRSEYSTAWPHGLEANMSEGGSGNYI